MFEIKILAFLWPFLKEMILGKKTIAESIKTNKKKVGLVFLVVGSLFLNMFTVQKLVIISEEYIKLQKKDNETIAKLNNTINDCTTLAAKNTVKILTKPVNVEPKSTPPPVPNIVVENPDGRSKKHIASDDSKRYNSLVKELSKMKESESK
jgi:hypothetical protein